MTEDIRRIRAVANALRGIRDRVNEEKSKNDWDTAAFDKWIRMLVGAIEGDSDDLVLEEAGMDRSDFLMHLDAAIGFLETYETDQSNVTPLKPRGHV